MSTTLKKVCVCIKSSVRATDMSHFLFCWNKKHLEINTKLNKCTTLLNNSTDPHVMLNFDHVLAIKSKEWLLNSLQWTEVWVNWKIFKFKESMLTTENISTSYCLPVNPEVKACYDFWLDESEMRFFFPTVTMDINCLTASVSTSSIVIMSFIVASKVKKM